jgi:hypothetical protein
VSGNDAHAATRAASDSRGAAALEHGYAAALWRGCRLAGTDCARGSGAVRAKAPRAPVALCVLRPSPATSISDADASDSFGPAALLRGLWAARVVPVPELDRADASGLQLGAPTSGAGEALRAVLRRAERGGSSVVVLRLAGARGARAALAGASASSAHSARSCGTTSCTGSVASCAIAGIIVPVAIVPTLSGCRAIAHANMAWAAWQYAGSAARSLASRAASSGGNTGWPGTW